MGTVSVKETLRDRGTVSVKEGARFGARLSSKCNTSGKEKLVGREPAEALSRSIIEQLDGHLKLLVGDSEEVAALGEEETEQAVRVFVGSALPRGVRIGEENRCAGCFFKLAEL